LSKLQSQRTYLDRARRFLWAANSSGANIKRYTTEEIALIGLNFTIKASTLK
jgi:hypothetical protein